jgi:hypothetical protein
LNKYGVVYDRTLPNLKLYIDRSVVKKGYDPKKYYTKTEAAKFHDRTGYIPLYDTFKALILEDEYQCGVERRRKSKADIDTTARHAERMIDYLDKSNINHEGDEYKKIRAALMWSAKHPRRT